MFLFLILMHVCCRFADRDTIDYHALLAGINWMEHPAPPVMPEDILKVKRGMAVIYIYETKEANKWEVEEGDFFPFLGGLGLSE